MLIQMHFGVVFMSGYRFSFTAATGPKGSNSYRLVYQTNTTLTPDATAAGGVVKYGSSATTLTTQVTASCRSYSIADMCGAPASSTAQFRSPGFIYDALLTPPQPATVRAPVYYSFSANGGKVWSPVKAFRNGPKSGVAGGRTRFLAYGDMGTPAHGAPSVSALEIGWQL